MAIETKNKDKEVVPPLEVVPQTLEEVPLTDDDVVVKEPPSGKHRNYGHYHEEGGPSHFCKVILASKLRVHTNAPRLTKHFPAVPTEFNLKMNIGCSWRVTVRLMNGRVTLDQGWAAFAAVHRIKIGYTATFKLLTPDTLKVIVLNDDGIEVVTKWTPSP